MDDCAIFFFYIHIPQPVHQHITHLKFTFRDRQAHTQDQAKKSFEEAKLFRGQTGRLFALPRASLLSAPADRQISLGC
jgi:hypothetical protein